MRATRALREPPALRAESGTARAAQLTGPASVEIVEIARREPGPEEIEVRIEGCGVCGSNLPVWEGRPWFEYPMPAGRPGHEAWGAVVRIGENVRSPRVGDRVAILSDRAFATHDTTAADKAVVLPDRTAGALFPGEAVACAMNAFRRSRVRSGDTVAVVGVGFLGALFTQLCARAGARVIGISRRPFARDVARQMGADRVVELADRDGALCEVQALTGGVLCDVVFEAAGLQDTLDLAAELTRVRGRLVIAGYHQDGLRQVDLQLWNWRGLDVVNAHEREDHVYVQGLREAVDAVFLRDLQVAPLLTHVLPLDEIGAAFELLRRRPDGFLKAVVTS